MFKRNKTVLTRGFFPFLEFLDFEGLAFFMAGPNPAFVSNFVYRTFGRINSWGECGVILAVLVQSSNIYAL